MDIKINQKIIKERCGTVSFKRGQAFCRAEKVEIHVDKSDFVKATVYGAEDFHVEIKNISVGNFQTSCSCSQLLDFAKPCQHVAAVLITIYEQQRLGAVMHLGNKQLSGEENLSNEFIRLFQQRQARTTGHQIHFEQREVLDVHFTLLPIKLEQHSCFFGIKVSIQGFEIRDIRKLLQDLKGGKRSEITSQFTYDSNEHCFPVETDTVLHQLIRVYRDEEAFFTSLGTHLNVRLPKETLLIPPTIWTSFFPLLKKAPSVSTQQNGREYNGLQVVHQSLPIQFSVEERDSENIHMIIRGLEGMVIMNGYQVIVLEGKIFHLDEEDFERFIQLKEMATHTGTNTIPIPRQQLQFFLKKVVPSLKKIGDVQLSQSLTEQMLRAPLVAKLYLDRVRNRLLAGIEFHYNHIVIQPLENHEPAQLVVRDRESENEILKLMEGSGFTKTEGGFFMQNEALEYEFLIHTLPKLQKRTQVFATTAVRNRVVTNQVQPKIRVKMHKERMHWLEFKFEMDGIPDRQIKEILAALEVKRKYYRLPNGSLLSLETKEMEAIRAFLEAEPIQDDDYEATLARPVLEGLKFLNIIGDTSVFAPEESFRQFLNQLLHPETLDFDVPRSLASILRDYQKTGFKWMKLLSQYGFGGVLADDMGLGKTLQSITFIVSELETIRAQKAPVLIVCPTSLTYNWLNEFLIYAPEIQAIVMDGTQLERKEIRADLENGDVFITSYPILRRDLKWFEKQFFHTIFFDEAQAFKNPFTQTARSVKKLQANHRFGLTGTPMENAIEELWSIYHVIFPQLFQGLEAYSHLTRKAIADRVRPFMLRRVKEDVLGELPAKEETLVVSELLPDQKKLYAAYLAKLKEETLKHLDKETFHKNKIRILAGLTRLRQICCHPALFVEGYQGSSAKFKQLLQILDEAKMSGRRVLIFSQFTKMLDLIGRELITRGRSYFYLDGSTAPEERVDLCGRFNGGERDLFLISLKAGGTGLNLTGADTVILYDLWWNPAVEEQAADRAHRLGQKHKVEVIKLVARGTIEEKMNELQEKKRKLIADIIDTEGNTSVTLTEEDIREILRI